LTRAVTVAFRFAFNEQETNKIGCPLPMCNWQRSLCLIDWMHQESWNTGQTIVSQLDYVMEKAAPASMKS
jgi:hypothetical protein